MKLIKKFSEYKINLIKMFFDDPTNIGSGAAWKFLQKTMDKPPSRASVIFFLNDLVTWGYLKFIEATGKGGYHKLYFLDMSNDEFINLIYKNTQAQLDERIGILK